MTKEKLNEDYGIGKLLNELKRSDFSKYCDNWSCGYKTLHIRIEFDYYNDWWIYSSDTHAYSGKFCGSLTDLKNKIKYDYNNGLIK